MYSLTDYIPTLNAINEEVQNIGWAQVNNFHEGCRERDDEDAVTVEEYREPVTVDCAGMITDEAGRHFGPNVE